MRVAHIGLICLLVCVFLAGQNKPLPYLKKAELPRYPPLARQARIEGTVQVSFDVGQDGTVSNVKATSGHPMLKPAAVENVRTWQFGGIDEKNRLETEFVFRLANDVDADPRLTVSLQSFRRIEVTSDVVLIIDSATIH